MRYALLSLMLVGCGGTRKPPIVPFGMSSDVNVVLVWLVFMSILGIGACIAAAIFLPIKKLAVAGIAGFASILGIALFVKAALPYLPWIVLGLIAVAIALAVVYFRRYVLATHAAVDFGYLMTRAETDEQAALLKVTQASVQDRLGVKSIIDASLKKIKGH